MPLTLAAVLLLATPDDAEIAKALRNLAQIHSLASVLEMRRAAGLHAPFDLPPDAWGRPYRTEGKRIVSAGSDAAFEEGPLPNEQFAGTAGDIVFDDGRLMRSNRNWLYARATSGEAAAALEELRAAELRFMLMRDPNMRALTLARLTAEAMQSGARRDAWGNELRVEGTRVISAGADGVFDAESWSRPARLDLGEDIIVDNGTPVRVVDAAAFLREHYPTAEAVPQPPDPPIADPKYARVGGHVKAPVVLTRVEPRYDDAYRRARISGIVILEAAISAAGAIDDLRLRKSCAPELDTAAMDAVRQWTFAPATRDGRPVDVIFHLTISFKLK